MAVESHDKKFDFLFEPVDDSIREEYVAANWLDSFFQ